MGDTDEFRYSVFGDATGEGELAGIMDSRAFLPEHEQASWKIYWHVDDVDATVALATSLGGSIVVEAVDTPYGRLAGVADPAGAQFALRTPND